KYSPLTHGGTQRDAPCHTYHACGTGQPLPPYGWSVCRSVSSVQTIPAYGCPPVQETLHRPVHFLRLYSNILYQARNGSAPGQSGHDRPHHALPLQEESTYFFYTYYARSHLRS